MPVIRFLHLIPRRIKALVKIAITVEQGHPHHRHPQISGSPQSISRQNPQTSTIGMHGWVKANFHGEISYLRLPGRIYFYKDHRYSSR
jgi:hypothetical protein